MNSTTMRAVGVLPMKREVQLVEHQTPQISSDFDVKIRSLEVGICGTDKEICHFVYGSPPEGFEYLVIGHESLGEVVEVGSRVRHFKKGDLVVPSVRRPCPHPHCRSCREDRQDSLHSVSSERGFHLAPELHRRGRRVELHVVPRDGAPLGHVALQLNPVREADR